MISAIRLGYCAGALLAIGACGDGGARAESDTLAAAASTTEVRQVAHDTTPVDTAPGPAEIVRRYYDSIKARDYDAAYALWGDSGRASRKTREAFASGFAQTALVHAEIGDRVRIEGAAGSQYATVPVVVDAVLRSGAKQHFTGTYTLRRAMVDGATPEQRRWHIYSANVR